MRQAFAGLPLAVLLLGTAAPPLMGTPPALVPQAEIRALLATAPWQCLSYEPVTQSCEAVGTTRWTADGSGIAWLEVMFSAEPEIMLYMSMPVWATNEMECGRPSELALQLAATPALSDEVATMIKDRIRADIAGRGGTVSCTGLVRAGDGFRTYSELDGAPQSGSRTIHFFAARPRLRIPDRPS